MTPAEYARVKEVFIAAIQVPDHEQDEFVREQCGDQTDFAAEVFSLLKHHGDQTILGTRALLPAAGTSPDDDRTEQTQRSGPKPSRGVVDATEQVDTFLVLSDVWNDNRQILRRRLVIIACVLAALIAISTVRLFTYHYVAWGYGVRVFVFVTCVVCGWVLHRNRDLTLGQIRVAEWIMMATVGLFVMVVNLRLMLDVAAADDGASLITVNHWHYFAWTLIIFVYGVFMPNSWQRAAAILLPVAAIPFLVQMLVGWWNPHITALLAEDQFGEPVPTPFVAAAISIYAAHLIHSARVSAFQAKRVAQYELKQLIGEGGMGQVFEAEHRLLRRACAVKLIRPEHCADDSALQNFEEEVRATAKLTHPHTIEVYDFGQTKDGVFFFAMELLPGMNLQTLVDTWGPLTAERALHFLTQVCDALAEAHDAGLIHRDVKPANIFASQRGGIYDFTKLLDFGVVREVNVSPDLSRAARIVGTPTYMSPEQIVAPSMVDGRSDLYALGAVGYFLLTGDPPFVGKSPMKIMRAQVNDAPTPLMNRNPDIPADLESVIMRCLSKQADRRPAGARELLKELRECRCTGSWTREDAASWWSQRDRILNSEPALAGVVAGDDDSQQTETS